MVLGMISQLLAEESAETKAPVVYGAENVEKIWRILSV